MHEATFGDRRFDTVFAIHVNPFRTQATRDLGTITRLLEPGGAFYAIGQLVDPSATHATATRAGFRFVALSSRRTEGSRDSSAKRLVHEDEIPPFVGMTGFGDLRGNHFANRSRIAGVLVANGFEIREIRINDLPFGAMYCVKAGLS